MPLCLCGKVLDATIERKAVRRMRASLIPRQLAGKEAFMEPARAGIHKIVTELLRQVPADQAIGVAWGLVCGRTVSEKTKALRLDEGVLRVSVPDEGWRSNLGSFVPRYVELLQPMLSQNVHSIEFVVEGKKNNA